MKSLTLIALFAVISPVSVAVAQLEAELVLEPTPEPVVEPTAELVVEPTAEPVVAPSTVEPAPEPPIVVVGESTPSTEPEMEPTPGVILVVVREQPAPVTPPVQVVAPEPVVIELPPEPEPFTPGAFSIGLSGLVGTHAGSNGDVAPTWTSGIDVGLRITSLVTIGVRRITVNATEGGAAWAFGGAPYVELAWRLAERFEPYMQLGAVVQGRTSLASSVGVAPFTGGGMRFYLASCFSLAVEAAAHVPVTDDVLLGHELFPFGSVVLQGGLAFTFHIG